MVNDSILHQREKAQFHAWFHHDKADGYIAIAKKEGNEYKQYHYQPENFAVKLTEWLGEDVYFSQNTFYKPSRQIENIRQLRSLYVDVDCYLLNYDPDWVVGKLELELFGEKVPDPNLIIFSGRGVVPVWLLEPSPYKALPLWQSVQNYLVKQFEKVGADSKASDAARIFRIAGSVNSKNGEEVRCAYRHDYRYSLREIQENYLPALIPKKKTKGGKKGISNLFNTHSLHHARLLDLVQLVTMRQGHMTNMREVACFLYRYWSCCFIQDPEEALSQTLEFNKSLFTPLSKSEAIRATKSAEKAWVAKHDEEANRKAIEEGYPGAGYNISNTKLIDWLDITPEEQKSDKTLEDTLSNF